MILLNARMHEDLTPDDPAVAQHVNVASVDPRPCRTTTTAAVLSVMVGWQKVIPRLRDGTRFDGCCWSVACSNLKFIRMALLLDCG